MGIAESMARELGFVTDPFDGFVTVRIEALEDRIDSLLDKITDVEARLEKRRELLLNQFVNMETSLALMSAQSLFLSTQLRTLSSLFS